MEKLSVFLMSMLPFIELRGAIPFGVSVGLTPLNSMVISFLGSMVPVPFILFTIRPILNYLKSKKTFESFITKLTDKSVSRGGEKIIKYGVVGLVVLVAIPVPGTGVWSGSLAASLIDMRIKLAFPAIMLGNLLAAIQIMTLSHGVLEILT